MGLILLCLVTFPLYWLPALSNQHANPSQKKHGQTIIQDDLLLLNICYSFFFGCVQEAYLISAIANISHRSTCISLFLILTNSADKNISANTIWVLHYTLSLTLNCFYQLVHRSYHQLFKP